MENGQPNSVPQTGHPLGEGLPEYIREQNVWQSTDKIVIQGTHFETITNFMGMFRAAIMAVDATVAENKATGVIKSEFYDEKGNQLSQELVNDIYRKMSAMEASEKQAREQPLVEASFTSPE